MSCTFTASTLKWKHLLLSILCSLQAPLSFLGSSFLVTVLFSPRIFQSCFSVLKGNSDYYFSEQFSIYYTRDLCPLLPAACLKNVFLDPFKKGFPTDQEQWLFLIWYILFLMLTQKAVSLIIKTSYRPFHHSWGCQSVCCWCPHQLLTRILAQFSADRAVNNCLYICSLFSATCFFNTVYISNNIYI